MEKDINYLFAMSKQDSAFTYELTEQLIALGKRMARNILKKYAIFSVILEDVEDLILQLVYYITESYVGKDEGFERYARFVFNKRLTSAIVGKCVTLSLQVDSLDVELSDGSSIIEMIPDQRPSIPDQISLSEVKLIMSSPKPNESEIERNKHKVFKLQCAGYSSKEIMEILNLSEGQFRYLLKMLNKDAKIFQYKIDIK